MRFWWADIPNFYPRPPRGGRRRLLGQRFRLKLFLSTPSARRATQSRSSWLKRSRYFYPRPPRGGRRSVSGPAKQAKNFYPRPPRGGRLTGCTTKASILQFLSTPSARRATHLRVLQAQNQTISIHALREEGDTLSYEATARDMSISIHALREEGDLAALGEQPVYNRISIHALREEGDACLVCHSFGRHSISIHALREEGDTVIVSVGLILSNFYPRPPRGGRPGQHGGTLCNHHISIHALREEGDATPR